MVFGLLTGQEHGSSPRASKATGVDGVLWKPLCVQAGKLLELPCPLGPCQTGWARTQD